MEKELANTERRETELRHEAERLRSDVEAWKVSEPTDCSRERMLLCLLF